MSTEAPAGPPVGRTDPAPSGADALQPQRTDISFLSPSARTSFTRVDVGAENDEDDGSNGQDELEVEQQPDDERAEQEPEVPQTPQVSLTFLLVTGKRRTMSFEPETTVGRAKELVWNAWPNGALLLDVCCFCLTISPTPRCYPAHAATISQNGKTSDHLHHHICEFYI